MGLTSADDYCVVLGLNGGDFRYVALRYQQYDNNHYVSSSNRADIYRLMYYMVLTIFQGQPDTSKRYRTILATLRWPAGFSTSGLGFNTVYKHTQALPMKNPARITTTPNMLVNGNHGHVSVMADMLNRSLGHSHRICCIRLPDLLKTYLISS